MQAIVTQPVTVTPPPEPLGMWGSYRAARRNALTLFPEAAYRERIVFGGAGAGYVMLMDPDGIERVLRQTAGAYPRARSALRIMKPRRGDNIMTAPPEVWRAHRKAMARSFTPRALDAHAPAMARAAEATSDRIAAAGGAVFDALPMMMDATRDVICDLALTDGATLDRAALTRDIDAGLRTITRPSLLDLLRLPLWVPRPEAVLNRSRARLDAMTSRVVAARLARGPSDPPDILDHMLTTEAGEGDEAARLIAIRNNLLALLFAGHETTALALTWSLYLLTQHPGEQERCAAAAGEVLGGRAAGAGDRSALRPIRNVVEEALRLYPPAALLSRQAAQPDTLAGHPVAAQTTVIVGIFPLHRHVDFWDAPHAFRPERFAEPDANRPRFAYMPFGGGPRVCVGAEFALMEAELILATLLAQHRFALAPGFQPEPRMWFTLRPADGMRLVARPRG